MDSELQKKSWEYLLHALFLLVSWLLMLAKCPLLQGELKHHWNKDFNLFTWALLSEHKATYVLLDLSITLEVSHLCQLA